MRALTTTVALFAAVLLTGCFQLPGQVVVTQQPSAPAGTTAPQPVDTTAPQSSTPTADVPTGTWGPVTVDDGAGDTWTYTVDGVVVDVPLSYPEVPAGSQAVSLVLSATHDDGSASWTTCFDVELVTDTGTYLFDGSAEAAENDVYGQDQSFSGGLAPIIVPAGTDLSHWRITSRYGDDVQDIAL